MIEDLRFVEKLITIDMDTGKWVKILQAYDGHVWFDVPLIKEVK